MKKILFLLFYSVLLTVNGQSYQTGTITLTFNDPSRTGGFGSGGGPGRQIQSEIYYPATTAGSNVAVASGTFPVVVIGHGFVMSWDSYSNIYSSLSKQGYIVVLPRTEGSTSPSHSDFALDLSLVGNKLLQLNATNTLAPIFTGKVSQKLAIGGHSMGGGSSFLSAKNNNTLTCLFNFAAAQTNPASSEAAKFVTVPTLIIGGEKDCVAPAPANQNKMWDSTASSKKFAVIIKNLTHCDFGNGTNFNCNFGQNSSGCGNTINNQTAFALYMNFLNPFLDGLLKNNCTEANRFMDSVNFSQVIFSKKIAGSILCTTTDLLPKYTHDAALIYPNPAGLEFFIKGEFEVKDVKLISIDGRVTTATFTQYNENEIHADITSLAPGIYFISLKSNKGDFTYKIIKE